MCTRSVVALDADMTCPLRSDALLMHPGPINHGVEMTVDPGTLPHSVIAEQVTNGVAVRMAVLFDVLGTGDMEEES